MSAATHRSVSSRTITRNAIWNFLGVALPLPAALIAVPPLIRGIGVDLFGLLTIAWAVMGYFSLFDLGLGRATTRYMAAALHREAMTEVRALFWSSFLANALLGLLAGVVLFAITPWLVRLLTIPAELGEQATITFYLLAGSVVAVVASSVPRGVLAGAQRFDLLNLVRIPASLLTYLGPLATLAFTDRLPPMILVIAVGRAAVLVAYLVMCFRVLPGVRPFQRPTFALVKPLAAMGGWLTATTVVTPAIVSIDRFIVGSVLSVGAVTPYAAGYEVVTKLWMFSASLLGALFPAFSVMVGDPAGLGRLYRRAVSSLFVLTTPAVGIVVALSPDFFRLWLGPDLGVSTVIIARLLAIGVLINVLAQVPFTVLQATGHADVTGKLQLAELPLYALATWFAAERWGVAGVAGAWTARAAADALLMFAAAAYRLPGIHAFCVTTSTATASLAGVVFLAWCWGGIALVSPYPRGKVLIVGISAAVFMYAYRGHFGSGLRRPYGMEIQ